jgi:hypothetical protein
MIAKTITPKSLNMGPCVSGAAMNVVQTLFVTNREGRIEIVYYCPICEAVNDLIGRSTDQLLCRECKGLLSATNAQLEVTHPPEPEPS